ncbi:unnamed protein product [Cuscuta campestris]|uniref:Uncharacterized protein n=1 Tax=Cuscuta campestris TaxID=132261 RepID=A0A484N0X0_9ASTE|nr:unnamed protein product [Cuscuta campestris]
MSFGLTLLSSADPELKGAISSDMKSRYSPILTLYSIAWSYSLVLLYTQLLQTTAWFLGANFNKPRGSGRNLRDEDIGGARTRVQISAQMVRRDFSNENWEISRYDGDFSVKVSWDSNRFGHFARIESKTGSLPNQIIIPAGFYLEGLKLFSKGLSELLRNSKELNNHLPKPLPIQEGLGLVKICKDEGWRCYNGVPSATICDKEQINTESRVIVDLTMEEEMESLQRHTPLAEVPLDQGCLDIFHQVIKDNMNLFRKSIASKQFLDALNKGQILNYSEEVVRVTREAIKSFEYIDAATMEGARYPVYLAYAKEDMNVVLAHLCGEQD